MLLRVMVCLTTLLLCAESQAQGLRVSTLVYDMVNLDAARREPIVSSSLSLFHNGRVYDYVGAADQVVIFDPVEKKFTILNTARELVTTLNFEEIRHMLDSRAPAIDRYISDLEQQNSSSAEKIIASLRFQMNPGFTQTSDFATGRLILSSPVWNYRVTTRPWKESAEVERYLSYADWTARLNYLLHPNSLAPEPRIELNNALRSLKNQMPVSVELDLAPNENLRLRAEHKFTQSLADDDHRRIVRWEQMLSGQSLQKVSFRNYQQTVLISKSR